MRARSILAPPVSTLDVDARSARAPTRAEPRSSEQRLSRELRRALARADVTWCLRVACDLDRVPHEDHPRRVKLALGFEALVRDGAERAPWGFDRAMGLTSDLCAWSERGDIDPESAFFVAATALAEPLARLESRPVAMVSLRDESDPARVIEDLFAGRAAEAEARVRHLARERDADAVVREALLPAVARDPAMFGHAVFLLARAWELARRFQAVSEDILASAAVMLAVTLRCASHGAAPPVRTVSLISVAPEVALRSLARAAATCVARFDRSWELRADSDVSVLDATAPLAFLEAAWSLASLGGESLAGAFIPHATHLVERARVWEGAPPAERPARAEDFGAALRARDTAVALGAARASSSIAGLWPVLARFAACEAAVRTTFVANAVNTVESLRRLAERDPAHAREYLHAAIAGVAPHRPERFVDRVVAGVRRETAARNCNRTG
jgi:hypothetical protein